MKRKITDFINWFNKEKFKAVPNCRYITYTRTQNEELFAELDKIGIWHFYVNNKGSIISHHQIVVYCYEGVEWLERGLTSEGHECDHIDSDVTNNKPSNLKLLSIADHVLCTMAQQARFMAYQYLDYKQVYNEDKHPTEANKKGEVILNHGRFLTHYLHVKMLRIAERLKEGKDHLVEGAQTKEEFYSFLRSLGQLSERLKATSNDLWGYLIQGNKTKKLHKKATEIWLSICPEYNLKFGCTEI